MFLLRTLAGLKFLRPWGQRYQEEQALIEQWLDSVTQATAIDRQLGLALARCGRLIKGYGSTNERGKENLRHILQTVCVLGTLTAHITMLVRLNIHLRSQQ